MKVIYVLAIVLLIYVNAGFEDNFYDVAVDIHPFFVEEYATDNSIIESYNQEEPYGYYNYQNNYWQQFPNVTGYSGFGGSYNDYVEGYAPGREHVLDYEIKYENGIKLYIESQYKENYPNEMGLCLKGRIENDTLVIYNYSGTILNYQDENSTSFDCEEYEEDTIMMHSHPDIQRVWNMCYPSSNDLYLGTKYEMIVCGVGKDITKVIAYTTLFSDVSYNLDMSAE